MQPSSHAPQSVAGLVPSAAATSTEPSLLRAMAFGIGVVMAVLVLLWLARLLPAETTGYVALGAGGALLAGVLALWLHGRMIGRRGETAFAGDVRRMAGHLQGLLAAAFVVKLAVLVLGVLYLQRVLADDPSDAKFAATASFCIAFAGASLVCQLATAGYLARALGRRTPSAVAAPTNGPTPAPNASAR